MGNVNTKSDNLQKMTHHEALRVNQKRERMFAEQVFAWLSATMGRTKGEVAKGRLGNSKTIFSKVSQ